MILERFSGNMSNEMRNDRYTSKSLAKQYRLRQVVDKGNDPSEVFQ